MSNRKDTECEQALQETPLTLKAAISPKDILTCKIYYRVGQRERKIELPVNSMDDSEAILYSVSEFTSFVDDHDINGPRQFAHYRETLNGTARASWDAARQPHANVAQQTPANFILARNAFLRTFFPRTAYDALVTYLSQVRKPNKMTELELSTRLRTMQMCSTFLPPPTDPQMELTDLRMKKIYFHVQRIDWQQQHKISSHPHIETPQATLASMCEVFSDLEAVPSMHTSHRNNDNHNNNRGGSDRNNNGNGGRRGGRRNAGKRGSDGKRNDEDDRTNKRRNKRQSPDDDCKCHRHLDHNHKWKDCVFNPQSEAHKKRHERFVATRPAESHQIRGGSTTSYLSTSGAGTTPGGQCMTTGQCSQGTRTTAADANGQTCVLQPALNAEGPLNGRRI